MLAIILYTLVLGLEPPPDLGALAHDPAWRHASMTAWAVDLGPEGRSEPEALRLLVRPDYTYTAITELTKPGTKFPWMFSELTHEKLRTTDGFGKYSEFPAPDSLLAFPGASQVLFHPWPLLGDWVDRIAQTSDHVVSRGDGGIESLTSASLGWRIEYQASASRLKIDITNSPNAASSIEFLGIPGLSAATSCTFVRELRITGRPTVYWKGRLVEFNSDAPAAEARVIVDPVAWKLDRFDPKSTDVFGPDGRLRYNEKELLIQIDGSRGWLREHPTAVWSGVSTLGVLSLFSLYRRRTAMST